MRSSDPKKGILTLMDTKKRIQRFSKIIIVGLGAKSVHEKNGFVNTREHPIERLCLNIDGCETVPFSSLYHYSRRFVVLNMVYH